MFLGRILTVIGLPFHLIRKFNQIDPTVKTMILQIPCIGACFYIFLYFVISMMRDNEWMSFSLGYKILLCVGVFLVISILIGILGFFWTVIVAVIEITFSFLSLGDILYRTGERILEKHTNKNPARGYGKCSSEEDIKYTKQTGERESTNGESGAYSNGNNTGASFTQSTHDYSNAYTGRSSSNFENRYSNFGRKGKEYQSNNEASNTRNKSGKSEQEKALEFFGLKAEYTEQELKAARNRLLKQYHPDETNGNVEMSQKIIAYYNLLKKGCRTN